MMPHLIAKAFKRTGIYPVNHSIFTLEDFAPSRASSTIAYVPDTFPHAFPASDPIKYSDSESIQNLDDSDSTFIIDDEPDCLDDNNSGISGTECDPMDANPVRPVLGLMTALMQLESEVLHRTCSVTSATLGESRMVSLEVSSLKEDGALSHKDLLGWLCLV